MQAPVGRGAVVVPRGEHRIDAESQLVPGPVWEGASSDVLYPRLHDGNQVSQGLGTQCAIAGHLVLSLCLAEKRLQHFMRHAHDHVAEHSDETAVGIVSKAWIAGRGGQTIDRLVVKPDVEHRVHHARHGLAGAGPHRQQ